MEFLTPTTRGQHLRGAVLAWEPMVPPKVLKTEASKLRKERMEKGPCRDS